VSQFHAADADLLDRARRGEEAAFLALYREHRTPIFRYAWRLTGSTATAEDATQECFVALLSGGRFDPSQGSLRTYLFGVARHIAMRRMRLEDREIEDPPDRPSVEDSLESLIGRERAAVVAEAVAALPPLQREALILHEYEDLKLEEIAAITGVETGAVKARLFRARETLRKRLAPLLAPASHRSCV
jgi:RNA polymerase sigma-70 factor, ECF subfamily